MVPSRTRAVTDAITASTTHRSHSARNNGASEKAAFQSGLDTESQTNTPSHPDASASAARSASTRTPPSTPRFGSVIPNFMGLRVRGRYRTEHERAEAAGEIVGIGGLIFDECPEDQERGRQIDAEVEVGVVVADHTRDRATQLIAHMREQ